MHLNRNLPASAQRQYLVSSFSELMAFDWFFRKIDTSNEKTVTSVACFIDHWNMCIQYENKTCFCVCAFAEYKILPRPVSQIIPIQFLTSPNDTL